MIQVHGRTHDISRIHSITQYVLSRLKESQETHHLGTFTTYYLDILLL